MSTVPKSQPRQPTQRTIPAQPPSLEECETNMKAMILRAKEGKQFGKEEVAEICNSLRNLSPKDAPIQFEKLTSLLQDVAHLSHKDWGVTSNNGDKLSHCLAVSSGDNDNPLLPHAQQLLERILKDGNWAGATENRSPPSTKSDTSRPWAVLVTGVNGIRKTTSMYQPWFHDVLNEALCQPASHGEDTRPTSNLPTGQNSFFRQLDHMIATVCNEEFYKLYSWATSHLPSSDSTPTNDVVQGYSDYKAAIFTRYRTLAELLGALLLKEAQRVNINCLMETSGKDVAMFHYVDHLFGSSKYNKLALRFVINDLECAKGSVDRRMIQEIQDGAKAIQGGDAFDVVYTNAGGPYGSQVLEGIQKDSDKVWKSEVATGNVGSDWFKATVAITAHPTEPWTAQAVKPDGSLGTKYTFERQG